MRRKKINELTIFQSRLLLKYPELIHGISTRLGGVSRGPYRSLNLSYWVGDKVERVLENRRRFCQALRVSLGSLTLGQQVHGCKIKLIRSGDGGKCSYDDSNVIQGVDALVTNEPSISLLALSADCPLILCYDPIKKVIGTIHASWRGGFAGIIHKTVQQMRKEFGSNPAKIRAMISPAIGPCCYQVQKDFMAVLRSRLPRAQNFIRQQRNRTYFDLWAFSRDQLEQSGLRSEHIECANVCTRCNSALFYSWRRDGGQAGRFGALISWF